jgi:hypothetical protein
MGSQLIAHALGGQMKLLPADRWAKFLQDQPETGMGYQTGDVTLADGRVFRDVIIVGGYITKIRGRADIPFEASEIARIDITGRRWSWDE